MKNEALKRISRIWYVKTYTLLISLRIFNKTNKFFFFKVCSLPLLKN